MNYKPATQIKKYLMFCQVVLVEHKERISEPELEEIRELSNDLIALTRTNQGVK